MVKIRFIDGYPCIELNLGYSYPEMSFSEIQSLKEIESNEDLMKEIKDKFKEVK
jgi:hypothetical protein